MLFDARSGANAVTKRDLVRYYVTVAPVILPHLARRPLNLFRLPNGTRNRGFWQKAAPSHAPEWIPRWRNEAADAGETSEYLVVDATPALAWLANHAAVELHAWTSRVPDVHLPTYALIDIDPGPATAWDDVVALAQLHRTALDHLGVVGYPKLRGKRGVQVWIPIAVGPSFAETRRWVEILSRAVGAVASETISWRWEKSERAGLARLDYTQNAVNKTLVAPYSVRAAPGAPVSVPVSWEELERAETRSDAWTVRTVPARLASWGDPMASAPWQAQSLPTLEEPA